MSKKYILTDMGGVLLNLNWEETVKKMLSLDYSLEKLMVEWLKIKSNVLFETGKINFGQYANSLIKEFNLKMSAEKVKQYYMEIIGTPKDYLYETIRNLKKNFNLAILSNTTSPHIEYIKEKYKIFSDFDYLFFSYEIKYMKPSIEAFEVAVEKMSAKKENVLFFDDCKMNVDGAISFWLKNSFLVSSPQEIEVISNGFL
mgnify:CR=1 FL=1